MAEVTALAETDEEPCDHPSMDEDGLCGDCGIAYEREVDPEEETEETEQPEQEIVDFPMVTVQVQNLKVTSEAGKVKVSFEIDRTDRGFGVGMLSRMAVVGIAEVAIRSNQLQLPD